MWINENRMSHSLAVAKKMKRIAEYNNKINYIRSDETYRSVLSFGLSFSIDPDEAFTLGFLHDIGYEFCSRPEYHAAKGGEFLKKKGYKYWQEVFYHGCSYAGNNSHMMDLLNYCDMTTDPSGNTITMEERVRDIRRRYGDDSVQAFNAERVMKNLTSLIRKSKWPLPE